LTSSRFHALALAAFLAGALCLTQVGCRRAAEPGGPAPRVIEAMNRGVSLMGQYLYDDAAKAFEEALAAAPHLVEARLNLAIALFNRNRKEDLDAAEKLVGSVLEANPSNTRALYFQAIVLQHAGKAEEAIPPLERVVQDRPNDGAAWYLLALCKQRTGRPAEADFLRAVEHRPYLYSAYYQLYQSALRANQDGKAQEYLAMFKTLRASPLGESIELPQYNQMGDLALAQPLSSASPSPITKSHYRLKTAVTLLTWTGPVASGTDPAVARPNGAAAGDLDGDGRPDLIVPLGAHGGVALLRQTADARFSETTVGSGLEGLTHVSSCAIGDFDNDDIADLCVVSAETNRLFKGNGDGTFTNVTLGAGWETPPGHNRSGLFLDADHDGDLDLFICRDGPDQLWNNNGDGAFVNVADPAVLAKADSRSVLVLPGDVDQDRDMDLIVLRDGQSAVLFVNELLGHYREAAHGLDLRAEGGGALQDFNGDGLLDLVVLGGEPRSLSLGLGQGGGQFKLDETFARSARALESWGPLRGMRVSDIDLDGDLDVVCLGSEAHLLLNDGKGRVVLQPEVWKAAPGATLAAIEVADLTGDLVPDLIVMEEGATNRLALAAGELVPPSTALAIQPSGIRRRAGRTRSPASGYGGRITARAGLREQRRCHTGQSGGAHQSALPALIGLGGAGKADSIEFLWPDGVAQAEIGLVAGQVHAVSEIQRKISSCPVLFAWNGTRFEFITDFAGVGGLGYFAEPGVAAPPQVLEHVKIEAHQLRPRDGSYLLRVTEPMEESAYVDRLELLAIDHPREHPVFPDERLAISGPPPTHELLVVDSPIFAQTAIERIASGEGEQRDCADRIARVDRVYAFEPALDRRYIGFCRPHPLELDFASRLAGLGENDRVFLFINGFIEYPYSQTVYAASQSRLGWEPIRVDRLEPDGQWRAIVTDGGAPGGMGRMITIDLSRQIAPTTRKLRLTTNLELFYDQVFVARLARADLATVRTAPLRDARLRPAGFAREYSPDGRFPLIFDYELSDATAPFHTLKGAYTRYGGVTELLVEFDDRYVLVGPGDEIALEFDATQLPPLPSGHDRSFILVSHAYCKDMDLYTLTPQTLEPLPFRAMSRYPYPSTEQYPTGAMHQAFLKTYNTRLIE